MIFLIYFRYKDEIIFTWNSDKEELQSIVKQIHIPDTSIDIDLQMGPNIQFLDAYIENKEGILYSRVNHDHEAQSYTLPYAFGNSKAVHSHWLRSSLIRAVRYCTSVEDFNRERIYLEVTCLANGYSLEFVEKRIQHFYNFFDANSVRTYLDQRLYNRLRHRLFLFISQQKRYIEENRELEKKNELIRLSYLYEFGPRREFDQKMKEILCNSLESSNTASKKKKLKIKITTKNQYSLNALLSRQKPSMQ